MFEWQMRRVYRRLHSPEGTSRRRRWFYKPVVSVTFDDAFACLLETALPLTEQLGLPTKVFAVSECLGRRPDWDIPPTHRDANEPTMTIDELQIVASLPHCTIGSHTRSHRDLTKANSSDLREEVENSKYLLERIAGYPIADLAFPYGAFNEDAVEVSKKIGYTRVFTLVPRCENYPLESGLLGRFSMEPQVWKLEYLLTIDGAYRWLSPVRQVTRMIREIVRHD